MAPYEPPHDAHYTELSVRDFDPDFMWKVIGKEGRNFYAITDWLKLKYLWYDDKRSVVEIWGPYESLKNGAKDKVAQVLKMHHEIICPTIN